MIGITGTVRWRNQASATCAMPRPVCSETDFTAEMISAAHCSSGKEVLHSLVSHPRALGLPSPWNLRRQPFQGKINSDYNNFVARVALEVVDGSWWKHKLRVKTALVKIGILKNDLDYHVLPCIDGDRFPVLRISEVVSI
jgi:hypothetical protein